MIRSGLCNEAHNAAFHAQRLRMAVDPVQEAIDGRYYDEVQPMAGPEAIAWARALAQKEGIFTGISGGASFGVARRVAERAPAGSVVLCMLPDTGERYLSTPLFESIPADMDEEELALSRSTPGFQMAAA